MSFSAGEKHFACVDAISAAGRLAPPFFAAAGKNAMPGWVEPIGHDLSSHDAELRALGEKDWLDGDAAICASPKEPLEKSLIHPAIDHVQKIFRKFAPPAGPLLAPLDVRSSRNGMLWLAKAKENSLRLQRFRRAHLAFCSLAMMPLTKPFKGKLEKLGALLSQLAAA